MREGQGARRNATKPRRRGPKMKGCTKDKLTAAVLARGAEEAGFGYSDRREGRKGPQRPKFKARDE